MLATTYAHTRACSEISANQVCLPVKKHQNESYQLNRFE